MGFFDYVNNPDSVYDNLDGLDYMAWDEVSSHDLLKSYSSQTAKYSRELPKEAFLGLFNSFATLSDTPPENLQVASSLLRRAEEMPEYRDLKKIVEGDEWACAAGTGQFVSTFLENLPEDLKDSMEQQQKAQDQVDDLKQQMDALSQMGGSGQGQGQGQGKGQGQGQGQGQGSGAGSGAGPQTTNQALQKALEKAQQNLQNSNNQLKDALESAKHRIDNNMMNALKSAEKALEDMKNAGTQMGWGLSNGGGKMSRKEVEGLHKLAQFLNKSERLKEIIKMLGWSQKIMKSELLKKARGREKFVEFERNRDLDLNEMAPEEWAMMAAGDDSPLHLDWVMRAMDNDVLHQKFEAEDKMGKGACVHVKDTSGSMKWDSRFDVATAIEYVLMQQMNKEKRAFASIPFSDTGEFHVYDPGSNPDVGEMLAHLEFGYWHGTEPYAPIMKAIELVKNDPSFKEGYILITTDGAFAPPPENFLKALEEARVSPGVKVVAVVIDSVPGNAEFADKVICINDILAERDKFSEAIAEAL